MSDIKYIHECRLCKDRNVNIILPFGEVALANSYPTSKEEREDLFPLTLMKCDSCGLVS